MINCKLISPLPNLAACTVYKAPQLFTKKLMSRLKIHFGSILKLLAAAMNWFQNFTTFLHDWKWISQLLNAKITDVLIKNSFLYWKWFKKLVTNYVLHGRGFKLFIHFDIKLKLKNIIINSYYRVGSYYRVVASASILV